MTEIQTNLLGVKEESLEQLNKMVDFFAKADTFFESVTNEFKSNTVTAENFDDKIEKWNSEYFEILAIINQ